MLELVTGVLKDSTRTVPGTSHTSHSVLTSVPGRSE